MNYNGFNITVYKTSIKVLFLLLKLNSNFSYAQAK